MSNLELFLLGPTQVKLDEAYLEVKPRKALALLVYLVVTAERHSRDALATLLWPESSQSAARKSLRSRLSELNQTLGEGWIEADRESVGLRDGYWLDVAEFQSVLAGNEGDAQSLMKAADLYRDDFMTGFTLPDCPEFDEWQFFQAESLRQTFAAALEELILLLGEQEEYEEAVPYGRRWLALDPLHEPAHQALMRLYAQAGQQAAALRQYEQCRQFLEEELGIAPSQETKVLYQDIRDGKYQQREKQARPKNNLPVQTSTFIGRGREVTEIKRLLLEEVGCRLLNLVGPGGIGKTRLAVAVAGQLLEGFTDGVFFVSLAPLSETEDIVPTIAKALNYTFYGDEEPKTQLIEHLASKRMLLVVDNFEHLLDGAFLLSEILNSAPYVTLLVTSRERLNLQEEWGYDVQGLPVPMEKMEGSDEEALLEEYSSLKLFIQRARRVNARFSPSIEETADIIRICQFVDGLPLSIELAAPWVRVMSCREIADEIERNLDFLTTTLRNIPARHRSLRVVFEQTWERLLPEEQAVLQQLSVFRGGCTREAAEQVAGATIHILASLIDKALLHRNNLGRYELHELIRQFAESKLEENPKMAAQTRQHHQDYFVAFLDRRTADVKGSRQKDAITEIKIDMDNIRLVWRRGVANRDAEVFERSAECLFVFHLYSSGHYEAQVAFQQAAAAFIKGFSLLTDNGLPDELVVLDKQENLAGFLLAGQGYFLARTLDPYRGQTLLEQALALLHRSAIRDRHKEGFILLMLGWIFLYQGRAAKAQEYVEPTLAVLTETGDRWAEGLALLLWANTLAERRPTEAEEVYKRGTVTCRESGDLNNLGYTSQVRSMVNMSLGRYAQAKQYIDEATRAFEAVGNDLGLGYTLTRRGELATILGKYQQAIQSFQQALTNFSEARTEQNVTWTQILLANALRLYGDYDQAEQLYRQALETSTAHNHKRDITNCLFGLGCLAYDQGELHRAEQYHREVLTLCQQLGLEVWMTNASLYMGQVLAVSGQHRYLEAIQYFQQALDLAMEHQLAPIALGVCVGVAQLLMETAELEQAVELLALVEQHEASTFETKERARRLLRELEAQSQIGIIGNGRNQNEIDVWAVAHGLSADLKNLKAALTPGFQTPRHNLPVQTTTFIGREKEVADIKQLLLEENGCRLLTLVGPGGIGKTRLALATAVQLRDAFPNGVFFIPLAPVSEPDLIVQAIAESLRLTFYGNAEPKAQLLDYLSRRQMLLVVDNFEHLLEGTALLSEIVSQAPDVSILATSRERLNLREEWLFEMRGLDFPSDDSRSLDSYSATELFLQRARQAKAGFTPTEADTADIGRICQLVEGMPLGIELAAPWVKLLSCREIAAEIERSLDFLETTVQNVPDRHRSLRVVFEQTWARLSEQEKSVLRQLSVFRGGCTREAAEQVAGATLSVLSSLVDKALLRRENTGRYELHELIRQFAGEELSIIEKTETTHEAHCTYFADFLYKREGDLKGPRQKEAADEIAADFENVLIAWNWAVKQTRVDLLEKAMGGLGLAHEWYGRYQEGEQAFELAADKLVEIDTSRGQRVLANLLIRQAIFGELLGKNKKTSQILRQAQSLLETPKLEAEDTRNEQVAILMGLGRVDYNNGDLQNAGELYEQSLTLYQKLGDRWGEARALLALEGVGRNYLESGDPKQHIQQAEASKQLVLESLAIFRELEDLANIARCSQVLGSVFFTLGQATDAQLAFEECSAICKRQGRLNNNILILAIANLGLVKGWYFGFYENMRSVGQKISALAQELGYFDGNLFGLGLIGLAALPQGKYKETQQIYHEFVVSDRPKGGTGSNSFASNLAVLGYATRQLGQKNQTRQYLTESLRISKESRVIQGALYGLPLAALLLVDRGERERAIEIQALAWSFPVVANSRLLEDIAGQYLLAEASTLPSKDVAAAQARGHRRDLWTTIEELLTVFTAEESDGDS